MYVCKDKGNNNPSAKVSCNTGKTTNKKHTIHVSKTNLYI